jgi:hypothetical protein
MPTSSGTNCGAKQGHGVLNHTTFQLSHTVSSAQVILLCKEVPQQVVSKEFADSIFMVVHVSFAHKKNASTLI